MGGFGSGEHLRSWHYRRTVEACIEFKLGKLKLRKHIDDEDFDNYWSEVDFYYDNKLVVRSSTKIIKNFDGTFLYLRRKGGRTPIPLFNQNTNNGGSFPMMRCPWCLRKVLKLYLKPPHFDEWLCQKCHDLTHQTSRQSTKPSKFEYIIAQQMGVHVSVVMATINSGIKKFRKGNYYKEYLHTYSEEKEESEMQQTTIKMSNWEYRELDKLSQKYGLSRSEIIRRAVDLFIEKEKMTEAQLKKLKS